MLPSAGMGTDGTHDTSEREQFDFFSDDFQQRPHEHYAQAACHLSGGPQRRSRSTGTRSPARPTSRSCSRNYKLWSSDQGPGLAYSRGGVLVSVDPPQHTSDRRLVNKAFAPADLLAMEPDIRQLVE